MLEMPPGMGAQLMVVEPCEPTVLGKSYHSALPAHCSLRYNGKKWKADNCLATQLLWRLKSDGWAPAFPLPLP